MQIIRHSADGLPRKFTAVLIPLGAEVLSETKAQGRLESAKKRGSLSPPPPPFSFRLRIGRNRARKQTIISWPGSNDFLS